MSLKVLRYGLASTASVLILGGLIFGSELMSYVRTGAGSVRESVRDSVPIEFELQRARDLINEILPELHANIRIIAEDEVEIAAIEKDLAVTRDNVQQERDQLASLRDALQTKQVSYEVTGREFTRTELTERLAQRLTRVKDAELILASKEKLLENRRESLKAAMQLLDRARSRKVELEQKIESLVAQHRLVQASAVGSRVEVSDTKLARADQLLADIQKRLDIAERVLEHEASPELSFDEPILDEASLLAEVDAHLEESVQPKRHVTATEP
ncbi:MAG: signal peptide-containing protein [Planctomycetota bacterium]